MVLNNAYQCISIFWDMDIVNLLTRVVLQYNLVNTNTKDLSFFRSSY